MDAFYAVAYFCMAATMGLMLARFIRRSEFGLLIAYAEIFVFLGAFVYPALFYAGFVTPALEGQAFLNRNGIPATGALAHVTAYWVGSMCGVLAASYTTREHLLSRTFIRTRNLIVEERRFFIASLGIGGSILILYVMLIGPMEAIAFAASMRSGVFEDVAEDDQRFLFLKSIAFAFTFIICFVPAALRTGRGRIICIAYFVFILGLYLVSVSRLVILLNLVVPLLMFARRSCKRFSTFLFLCVVTAPLLFLFLLYGKPLGFFFYKLMVDDELVAIEPYLSEEGLLSAFFGNFEFVWFSIQAGLEHFFDSGQPFIPQDVILSAGGFIPSRVLDYLGLAEFSYRAVKQPLPCLNTDYFGLNCTIPPRELGLSAYVLPFTGAFILGLAKYFIFRRQEMHFLFAASRDYNRTWYPILVVSVVSMLFSFIPTVISQVAFAALALVMALAFTRLAASSIGRRSALFRPL
jgi:hypothetical protein